LDISAHNMLKDIYITGSDIEYIDVSHKPELLSIHAGMSGLNDIDVTSSTNIQYLSISSTSITNIDLSTNYELSTFRANDTGLSGVLDLRANTKLITVDVQDTQITEIILGPSEVRYGQPPDVSCDWGVTITQL